MDSLDPKDLTRAGSSSQLKAEGQANNQGFQFSDETQRFIDLWFDDGSWALEELGGHERTIITEILKAAGITNGNGASRWRDDDDREALTYKCICRYR